MDKPASVNQSTHLLDDLESIRQLLGDSDLQPPLLTDTVEQTPLQLQPSPATPPEPAVAAEDAQTRRQDTLLHLEAELRAAAQSIMQDVIKDYTPHIEAEIKRRLEARMERLVQRSE
ncbi:DNA polymerase III subunit chi [Pseudomonas sp. S75]|uniref:DNA polymerase III subunit chi n=1 Tax=unclassified Pseudomonas TaxID=196821 RepID=UPI0019044FCB|nr:MULTISPECIES: DNA polymerase III subunit chi [unclassified Pseudomonas]MBJ9976139.1 DNA polymerase III subunit chi [Pseudomonas sp. S30]MBK0155110.1 DNA polymerase III subunit chi [Pseudomonas sp. S75]